MKFTGNLETTVNERVDACDTNLIDPVRLQTLDDTGLMDTPSEAAFDRLARLAAEILEVPLTIVSLVGDKKQFFKAAYGLPAPFDQTREVPIDSSICRYTLRGEEIIAADSESDPLLMYHPTTAAWGISAFIAIPMVAPNGHVLGAFCAVDSKVRPWTDKDIKVMRELTASVMTEINLRTQVASLEVEREMRERFVATLTHDLRTPLTSALMNAQLLSRKSEPESHARTSADRIAKSIYRADKMIKGLLDANSLNAGSDVSLTLEECDLNQIATSVGEELAEMYGARFRLSLPSDPVIGYWDEQGLQRLIENLASNAVKYGTPLAPISIEVRQTSLEATLSVHNEGNPISLKDQQNLFKLFTRLHSAQTHNQRGWGIGLAVVAGITKGHDGKIEVQSAEKIGTTFTIRLPKDRRKR